MVPVHPRRAPAALRRPRAGSVPLGLLCGHRVARGSRRSAERWPTHRTRRCPDRAQCYRRRPCSGSRGERREPPRRRGSRRERLGDQDPGHHAAPGAGRVRSRVQRYGVRLLARRRRRLHDLLDRWVVRPGIARYTSPAGMNCHGVTPVTTTYAAYLKLPITTIIGSLKILTEACRMSEVLKRVVCVRLAMSESLSRSRRPSAEGRWLHRAGVARRRAGSCRRFAFGRVTRARRRPDGPESSDVVRMPRRRDGERNCWRARKVPAFAARPGPGTGGALRPGLRRADLRPDRPCPVRCDEFHRNRRRRPGAAGME